MKAKICKHYLKVAEERLVGSIELRMDLGS